ncbi:NF038132 family protein [Lichenicola sp.]|uniref:NF038132 family protein n=1 Tax=Lichenicola sp. TaxID=2804529 RepID=UPI003AFFE9A5
MKQTVLLTTALAGSALTALVCMSNIARAAPIPFGYSCQGGCGTDGADGDVPLSPLKDPTYDYVTTTGGLTGVGQDPITPPVSPTNGSLLKTPTFAATAGTSLSYYFDFITSDGGMYADNVWAALFTAAGKPVAELYNTTTAVSAYTIGESTVSWLGEWSNTCFDGGCGTTGWQSEDYKIAAAGKYYLEFGATNAYDKNFDTGLAIDGISVGGVSINPVPEPISIALFGSGLFGLSLLRWRRRFS